MNRLSFLMVSIFAAQMTVARAELPDCDKTTQPNAKDVELYKDTGADDDKKVYGHLCKVHALALHPTQFAVGMYEVNLKVEKLKKAIAKNSLKDRLKGEPEPIVVGPNGEFYIIDHHHLARALAEIDRDEKTYAVILENHLGETIPADQFLQSMNQKGWAYFVDETGRGRTASELEAQITDVLKMADDPFRSLAGEVRCDKNCAADGSSGFIKTGVPFEEFKWAEHFRKMPEFKDLVTRNLDQYIKPALAEVVRLKGQLPASETAKTRPARF